MIIAADKVLLLLYLDDFFLLLMLNYMHKSCILFTTWLFMLFLSFRALFCPLSHLAPLGANLDKGVSRKKGPLGPLYAWSL